MLVTRGARSPGASWLRDAENIGVFTVQTLLLCLLRELSAFCQGFAPLG